MRNLHCRSAVDDKNRRQRSDFTGSTEDEQQAQAPVQVNAQALNPARAAPVLHSTTPTAVIGYRFSSAVMPDDRSSGGYFGSLAAALFSHRMNYAASDYVNFYK